MDLGFNGDVYSDIYGNRMDLGYNCHILIVVIVWI